MSHEPGKEIKQKEKAYNISRLSFLVVDSSPFMRSLVKEILRSMGVTELWAAEDGAAALDLLYTIKPDIIISAWNLPNVNGIEFIKTVHNDKENANRLTPFIMFTSYNSQERLLCAINAGASEYIVKPFNAKSFYKSIKNLIKNPRHYMQTNNYFGPDRRHEGKFSYEDDERRKS